MDRKDKDEFFLQEDGTKDYEKMPDGSWKWGFDPESKKHRFKKGNKLGGRPKGSKNKTTLRQELLDQGGFSPAEFLNSVMNDENANISQRMVAARELIGFTEAKLSSIEVHTDDDHAAPFNIFLAGIKPEDVCSDCNEEPCVCDLEDDE